VRGGGVVRSEVVRGGVARLLKLQDKSKKSQTVIPKS